MFFVPNSNVLRDTLSSKAKEHYVNELYNTLVEIGIDEVDVA